MLKVWSHDLKGAVADLSEAVSRDYGGRSVRLRLPGLCVLCDAQYRLGQWDEAIVSGELAVSLATDTDQWIPLQQAHAVVSYIHAGRGSFELAERHLDAAGELAAFFPNWTGQVYTPLGRATLAQARADATAMREAVSDLLEGPLRESLERIPNWPWRVLVTEALVGAGALDEAQRALDDLDAHIARLGIASATTDAARLRGQLAEAGGDLVAAGAAVQGRARRSRFASAAGRPSRARPRRSPPAPR